jgi:hypothetical protein
MEALLSSEVVVYFVLIIFLSVCTMNCVSRRSSAAVSCKTRVSQQTLISQSTLKEATEKGALIVFITLGTQGDINVFLSLALQVQRMGHLAHIIG